MKKELKTWIDFISMLTKAGKIAKMSPEGISELVNIMVNETKGADVNGKAIRRIYSEMLSQDNKEEETNEQKMKRLKQQTKDANKVGKQRSVGYAPRVTNTVLNTAGDIGQTVGDVIAANASLPSVALTAMGQAMPQTVGEKIIGAPNMGGVISALGAAYGAAPAAAAHGAGAAFNKLVSGIGNDVIQTAADRQMQANLYQNTQDMMDMNVSPSQSQYAQRIASANATARRQAAAGGTY